MGTKFSCITSNISVNARLGRRVGEVSLEYPVAIQPTNESFGIWGVIYYRIFWYSLVITNRELDADYCTIATANSRWLEHFVNLEFEEAFGTIIELREALDVLRNKVGFRFDRFTLDVYYTWVSAATILQSGIYNKYVEETGDTSYDELLALLDGLESDLSDARKRTLEWIVSGVVTNDQNGLTQEQRDEIVARSTFTDRDLTVQQNLGSYLNVFMR